MNKREKLILENELAKSILEILMKHRIRTGVNKNGLGEFLECKIDFKFLNNPGGIIVRHLNFQSKVSDYEEPDAY